MANVNRPWPNPARVVYSDTMGSGSTSSTSFVDWWGGGTTKPITGIGIYAVTWQVDVSYSVTGFVSYQLQSSPDGTTWTTRDSGAGIGLDKSISTANVYHQLNFSAFYAKPTFATEYLKIQWRVQTAGTLTQNNGGAGWAAYVKVNCSPTW